MTPTRHDRFHNKNRLLLECVDSDEPTAEKLIKLRHYLDQRADVNTTDVNGNTPLHLAVSHERAIVVKLLLKRGAEVNAQNLYGNTPLHDAVRFREISVVELLINEGADINAQTKRGYTPLHIAGQLGLTSMADLLLKKGADVFMLHQFGSTMLHEAASSGVTSIVELFLNEGIDVCARDMFEATPLHRAADSGQMSVVELLLKKGADVNAQGLYGDTPLHGAARSGNLAIVELLLNKGAKVNPHTINGDTPLHGAVRSKKICVVESLLNKNANVNARTSYGVTPLHEATLSGDTSIVELLLKNGANADWQTSRSADTPLHRAARSGNLVVVKMVMNRQVDVNQRNVHGNTPLHEAARSGNIPIMEILLNNGADVNAQNTYGDSPLHMIVHNLCVTNIANQVLNEMTSVNVSANGCIMPPLEVESSKTYIVELLLNNGAKMSIQNNKGKSPLHIAAEFGLTSVADVLINYGADVTALAKHNKTPLHEAVESRNISIIEMLLNKDVDINSKNDRGHTPLHVAVQKKELSILKILLDKGSDVNARCIEGKTPLHVATELGLSFFVEQLLNKGADVNAQDRNLLTPLHGAASYGRTSTVNLLLYKSADVNAQTLNGETPLHVAMRNDYIALANLLINRGASVIIRNKAGDTPLTYALLLSFKGNQKIVQLLQNVEKEVKGQPRTNCYFFQSKGQDNIIISNNNLHKDESKYLRTADTSGMRGQLYEMKLVSLVFIRTLNHKLIEHDIFLGVNLNNIGAMDDLCLRYQDKNRQKPTVLFLQAKHKESHDRGQITDGTLWSESGDFSLRKYFESYLIIKERFRIGNKDPIFKGEFCDIDCYFVLYTSAKASLNKKTTENKLNATLLDLIGTGKNTEPFQYCYDETDIQNFTTEVDMEIKKKPAANKHFVKEVKDFFSKLWFYTRQAKEDEVERIVKKEINKYYNNEKDLKNICEFGSHTEAIFLKTYDEIRKWWKLKGVAPYLTRSHDFFRFAKLALLDDASLTVSDAVNKFKFSLNLKFRQRFNQCHTSDRTLNVFNTILSRLFTVISTENNENVNLQLNDIEISGDFVVQSSTRSQILGMFENYDGDANLYYDLRNEEQFKYSKRAGTSEVGGTLFRIKMLCLVLLRVLDHELIEQNPVLGAKIRSISNMNDICLRCRLKDQRRPIAVFMQLIHREDPEKGKLTDRALWTDSGDFSLPVFFKSYIIIREQFQIGNEDPIFKGKYRDVDCCFVLFTSAKETLTKKKVKDKVNEVVLDLINTGHNLKPFQYDYDEDDIDRLTSITRIDRIKKLGSTFLESILSEKYKPNLLSDKLIARYHVAMRREVIQQCEVQIENEEYRLWQFRPEFFSNELEDLVTLKNSFVKVLLSKHYDQSKIGCQRDDICDNNRKILESLEFRLPLAFGNLDMTFRGNEVKVQNRIKFLADKLMCLMELHTDTKIVVINDDDVGPGKTIEQGIVNINGGIGGSVGNLLVLDSDTNMLKFELNNKTLPHHAALLLKELQKERYKPFNEHLSIYRFNININDFPKDSFNGDEFDKQQARDFLGKLWFYPNQAKEDVVENIVKDEINIKYSGNIIRAKFKHTVDFVPLYSLAEIEKWWLQPSESAYLSRASELFERAELADLYSRLETVINYMYILNIFSIDVKVKRVNNNESDQSFAEKMQEVFKRLAAQLFKLFNSQQENNFELLRYGFKIICENSTLSLRIHPKMEWVALSVTKIKISQFENADFKHSFVVKIPGPARRMDDIKLYEVYILGRLYRFRDCLKNTCIELIR